MNYGFVNLEWAFYINTQQVLISRVHYVSTVAKNR